jgi:mannitol/fructose-specific phosphotransferase system IIA component (Ntr-type)
MANIIDFSDALTQEGLLAKKYVALAEEATNDDYKKILAELAELSEKKMKLVHQLLSEINWF